MLRSLLKVECSKDPRLNRPSYLGECRALRGDAMKKLLRAKVHILIADGRLSNLN